MAPAAFQHNGTPPTLAMPWKPETKGLLIQPVNELIPCAAKFAAEDGHKSR